MKSLSSLADGFFGIDVRQFGWLHNIKRKLRDRSAVLVLRPLMPCPPLTPISEFANHVNCTPALLPAYVNKFVSNLFLFFSLVFALTRSLFFFRTRTFTNKKGMPYFHVDINILR